MVIFVFRMVRTILRKTLLTVLLLSFGVLAYAQRGGNTAWTKYRHEVSLGYGMNNLFANLGERDSPVLTTVFQRSTFNASYRYFFLKHFAARGSFSHGFARKNDKALEEFERVNARLDYLSSLSEFAVMAEYHVIDETTKGKRGKVRRARGGMSRGLNVGVSFFAGVGLSYFRPYGEYFGEKVEFKPISDPLPVPNNTQYKRTRLAFPVGAQVRLLAGESWRIGLEGGYRFALNEYINYVSGVYYVDEDAQVIDQQVPDRSYVGNITFAPERTPVSELASEKGKRNYLFVMLTLSYRIKS